MDGKTSVLVLLALTLLTNVTMAGITSFYRDLFYNRPLPKPSELEDLGLKCIPGRTVIRVTERVMHLEAVDSDSDEYTRRSDKLRESLRGDSDERCSICICSVDGNHEVCIKKPAGSVNECILMEHITKKSDRNEPFEHTSSLAYRIRRVGDREAEQNHKDDKKCVPLVSEYTDCTPVNQCIGCTKCGCSPAGEWDCRSVQQCDVYHTDKIDDELFDAAVEKLDYELKKKSKYEGADKWKDVDKEFAPQTVGKKDESDELLGYVIAVPREQH